MTSLEILRRRRLLTQAELAKAAGVGVSTIYLIENGKRRSLRPRVMRAIAQALEVDPLEIDEFRRAVESEPRRLAA